MKPDHIIIHHSATKDGPTVSWQAIRRYHVETNGWRDIGYHYGIELINDHPEVLLGRMPTEEGAHCKEQGMNFRSLGICVVGDYDKDQLLEPTYRLLVKLVLSLRLVYDIPADNVQPHSAYAEKTCPGRLFPWARFIRSITSGL